MKFNLNDRVIPTDNSDRFDANGIQIWPNIQSIVTSGRVWKILKPGTPEVTISGNTKIRLEFTTAGELVDLTIAEFARKYGNVLAHPTVNLQFSPQLEIL